jgi:hypothetical protein
MFRRHLLIRGKYHAAAGYYKPRNCQKYLSRVSPLYSKASPTGCSIISRELRTSIEKGIFTGKVMIERNPTRACNRPTPEGIVPQSRHDAPSVRGRRCRSLHRGARVQYNRPTGTQGSNPAACIASRKHQLGHLDFQNAAGFDLVVLYQDARKPCRQQVESDS